MATSPRIRHVVITGAKGNLGRKLAPHLLERRICETITGIDRADGPTTSLAEGVTLVEADLANPADERWRQALRGADAVFHFAAQNPYPDSAWDDACASFDMTLHVVEAAAANGVRWVIFASSNHVMGQYKDAPLADRLSPGRPDTGPRARSGDPLVQRTQSRPGNCLRGLQADGRAAVRRQGEPLWRRPVVGERPDRLVPARRQQARHPQRYGHPARQRCRAPRHGAGFALVPQHVAVEPGFLRGHGTRAPRRRERMGRPRDRRQWNVAQQRHGLEFLRRARGFLAIRRGTTPGRSLASRRQACSDRARARRACCEWHSERASRSRSH